MATRRDIAVEVRRDYDGRLYSQVVDRVARQKSEDRRSGRGEASRAPHTVVIDRQRGRLLDSETVLNRAQGVAEVLGCDYDEDLFWPCRARNGLYERCACPECVRRSDERAAG